MNRMRRASEEHVDEHVFDSELSAELAAFRAQLDAAKLDLFLCARRERDEFLPQLEKIERGYAEVCRQLQGKPSTAPATENAPEGLRELRDALRKLPSATGMPLTWHPSPAR